MRIWTSGSVIYDEVLGSGGQVGHPGHGRKRYPPDQCHRIEDHYPQSCSDCGETLDRDQSDPYPHWHQVVEIPPIELKVVEHRFHSILCQHCGRRNPLRNVRSQPCGKPTIATLSK